MDTLKELKDILNKLKEAVEEEKDVKKPLIAGLVAGGFTQQQADTLLDFIGSVHKATMERIKEEFGK